MNKFIYSLCLILSLSTPVWALDSTKSGIKVNVLSKTSASWDGQALPDYPEGTAEITILKVTVPPMTQFPLHMHPVINAGVILKGELTVITEHNKTLHLKAGDAITEVVNTWHYGKNEGNETTEIIVFYAGIQGKPITIKKHIKK